jgi:hypothetical protein
MDFLGGVGAAGQRAIPALEERRMRETEIAENRKRYEDTLKQRALDEAFRQQEAGRDYDFRTQQGMLAEEAAARQAELLKLQQAEDAREAEAASQRNFTFGQQQGVMGLQKDLSNQLAAGTLKPGTPAFQAAALRAKIKPQDAAPDYYLEQEQKMRERLAGIARSPIPPSNDELVKQAMEIALGLENPEISVYSKAAGDPFSTMMGVDYQTPLNEMINGALGRVPDLLEQLKQGRYQPPSAPRNVPVPRIPMLNRTGAPTKDGGPFN